MDYFINNPCIFHHASKVVCKHLNLSEIKSLSLVSRQWFELTCASIVENCVFRAKNRNILENIRHYRKYKIEKAEVGCILRALHSSVQKKRLQYPRKNFNVDTILLENCILSEEDIQSLFQFESLIDLKIIHCKMGDGSGAIKVPPMKLMKLKVYNSIPIFIGNLINSSSKHTLRSLHLTTTKGLSLNSLEIPNLEKFTIWETDSFCDLDSFLRRHQSLTYCNFEGLQLPDFIFKTISKCLRKIETLKINRYSELSDYALEALQDLQNLENLSVSRMSLSADVIAKVGSPRLKTLDLGNLRTNLNLRHFQQMFQNMRNLTELKLSYCKQNITEDVVTLISTSFLNLKTLDLSGNDYLCLEGRSDEKFFGNLRTLNLDNSSITNDFLKTLNTPKLNELDICLDGVSCESIQTFMLKSPFIKKLYLRYCDLLTDKGFIYIVELLKYLEHLEVGQCNNLTIESVCTVLFRTFLREAYLTVDTTVEELNMVCLNYNFVLEHHGVISEINNGCREITVYRV